MKVIIAGSRTCRDYSVVCKAIEESGYEISEVVSGTAVGPDRMGERFAEENGLNIKRFPADWQKHGKSAGYIRNQQMSDYADALICIWDGESKGSKHMIDIANKDGLSIHVYTFNNEES